MARMNESQRCCTKVGRWTAHQRIASFPRTLFRDREGHMYDYTNRALTEVFSCWIGAWLRGTIPIRRCPTTGVQFSFMTLAISFIVFLATLLWAQDNSRTTPVNTRCEVQAEETEVFVSYLKAEKPSP